MAEFGPIYVLGMVRTSGLYPYREGLSVLGAIARAGSVHPKASKAARSESCCMQKNVFVCWEIGRTALLAKRARLIALQNGDDRIDFPDMSGLVVDPARIAQIRDDEQRAFTEERQAVQQETEALEKQFQDHRTA
jgi:polysaccharide export outer membrane protein